MSIKAIAFDMDGVLIDAKEWHFEAFQKALRNYGFDLSREEHHLLYDGLPTRVKLEILSQKQIVPVDLHTSIEVAKQSYFQRLAEKLSRPQSKHLFLLDQLNEDGYQLCVCSNAKRSNVNLLLQKANIPYFFEFSLSNEDVLQAKPSPEMYLKAAERFQIDPEEMLVIEDNENGLRAAWRAGAHVLMIENPQELTYELIVETIAELEGRKLYA